MQMWSLHDRLCLSNVLQCQDLNVWSLQQDVPDQKWEKIYSINILNIDRLDSKYRMIITAAYSCKIGENQYQISCGTIRLDYDFSI